VAWIAQSNGVRYYCRHRRIGRDVRRFSLGRGPVAEMAAALDQQRWDEQAERARARRAAEARHAAADGTLDALAAAATALLRDGLGAIGYHRHGVEWRRRRSRTMTVAGGGPTMADVARGGDLGAAAEAAWLDLASGGDDGQRAALAGRLAAQKADLLGTGDSPLERLLVDAIALDWLAAGYYAAAVARSPGTGLTPTELGRLERRRDKSRRTFLAAIKALVTARRLLPGRETAQATPSRAGSEDRPRTEAELACPREVGRAG
jgi:hypothetical protein